jgi:hypothetical protein
LFDAPSTQNRHEVRGGCYILAKYREPCQRDSCAGTMRKIAPLLGP